jgi:hypothetical protein
MKTGEIDIIYGHDHLFANTVFGQIKNKYKNIEITYFKNE